MVLAAVIFTLTAGEAGAGRRSTGDEWIAVESTWALADGYVIANGTFSVDTARRRARIDTAEVVADLVSATFRVFCRIALS